MTNEEYLALFENNDRNKQYTKLNETPNYNQNNWQQLNETPKSNYNINENVNDGWDDIQFETKINGVHVRSNQTNQMINARMKYKKDDLNGLNQFIDDDNLNEVYKQPQASQIPQVTEKIEEQDVVSVELFEKMNQNAMLSLRRLF
jgi:hypothetical protein